MDEFASLPPATARLVETLTQATRTHRLEWFQISSGDFVAILEGATVKLLLRGDSGWGGLEDPRRGDVLRELLASGVEGLLPWRVVVGLEVGPSASVHTTFVHRADLPPIRALLTEVSRQLFGAEPEGFLVKAATIDAMLSDLEPDHLPPPDAGSRDIAAKSALLNLALQHPA